MNRRTAVDDMRPLARGLRRASGARTPGPTVGISLSEAVLIRKVYCYIHCLHMDFWTLEVNCQGNKRQGKRVRTLRDFRTKSIRQCDLRGFKSEDPAGQVAPRRGARLDNPFIDRRYGDHAAYIFLVSTFLSNCRWHCCWSSSQWHIRVTFCDRPSLCDRRSVNFWPWFLMMR